MPMTLPLRWFNTHKKWKKKKKKNTHTHTHTHTKLLHPALHKRHVYKFITKKKKKNHKGKGLRDESEGIKIN